MALSLSFVWKTNMEEKMKNLSILILLLSLIISSSSYSQEKTEKSFKIVPLITSSPLMGHGLGFSTSYLYYTKNANSSKSQLSVGGQYTSTNSYNIFVKNVAFFKENKIMSNTSITFSDINNEFDSEGEDVAYKILTFAVKELLMFKVHKNYFLGGELIYRNVNYDPNNNAGETFISENGILDEKSGGLGIAFSLDNRKNKYYPVGAAWATIKITSFPEAIGAVETYSNLVLDGRYYFEGISEEDVLATQFYGQYSSEKTPDAALPTLSGKSLLRGYPAGQYKARYLTGGQAEYRYTFKESRFRLTGFIGVANLSGGSVGDGDNSRDDDGWYWAGGIGLRYKLQEVTGVDLRIDLVTTGTGVQSLYVKLNQAF